jgi:hypothetical protein
MGASMRARWLPWIWLPPNESIAISAAPRMKLVTYKLKAESWETRNVRLTGVLTMFSLIF